MINRDVNNTSIKGETIITGALDIDITVDVASIVNAKENFNTIGEFPDKVNETGSDKYNEDKDGNTYNIDADGNTSPCSRSAGTCEPNEKWKNANLLERLVFFEDGVVMPALNIFFQLQVASIEHDGYVNDPNHPYAKYPMDSIPASFVGTYFGALVRTVGLRDKNLPNYRPTVDFGFTHVKDKLFVPKNPSPSNNN